MPSLHGETFPFVLDDLLARPSGPVLPVEDFRKLRSAVGDSAVTSPTGLRATRR